MVFWFSESTGGSLGDGYVQLEEALAIGNRLIHIDDAEKLGSDERATLVCPRCRRSVFPKFGTVRARHFAHRDEGVSCLIDWAARARSALSVEGGDNEQHDPARIIGPESPEHRAAKHALGRLLVRAGLEDAPLVLEIRCSKCGRGNPDEFVVERTDEIFLERSVGNVRPDVSVWRRGICVGAFEVFVTNPVRDEKWLALAFVAPTAFEFDWWVLLEDDDVGPLVARHASPRHDCLVCPPKTPPVESFSPPTRLALPPLRGPAGLETTDSINVGAPFGVWYLRVRLRNGGLVRLNLVAAKTPSGAEFVRLAHTDSLAHRLGERHDDKVLATKDCREAVFAVLPDFARVLRHFIAETLLSDEEVQSVESTSVLGVEPDPGGDDGGWKPEARTWDPPRNAEFNVFRR